MTEKALTLIQQQPMAATPSDEELMALLAGAGLAAVVVASCPVAGCEVCDPGPQVAAA
jgi:hypothetical protein